jgi:hypothetical protein
MSNIAEQRARMWHKDPHCYWCRKRTRLVNPENGVNPPDMATIDHLYSRLDENRQKANHGIIKRDYKGRQIIVRHVLACFTCNQERGRLECKLSKLNEQRAAVLNGMMKKHSDNPLLQQKNQYCGVVLHKCHYQERKRRLKILKERAEKDIDGLVKVMGKPLKGGT